MLVMRNCILGLETAEQQCRILHRGTVSHHDITVMTVPYKTLHGGIHFVHFKRTFASVNVTERTRWDAEGLLLISPDSERGSESGLGTLWVFVAHMLTGRRSLEMCSYPELFY